MLIQLSQRTILPASGPIRHDCIIIIVMSVELSTMTYSVLIGPLSFNVSIYK